MECKRQLFTWASGPSWKDTDNCNALSNMHPQTSRVFFHSVTSFFESWEAKQTGFSGTATVNIFKTTCRFFRQKLGVLLNNLFAMLPAHDQPYGKTRLFLGTFTATPLDSKYGRCQKVLKIKRKNAHVLFLSILTIKVLTQKKASDHTNPKHAVNSVVLNLPCV